MRPSASWQQCIRLLLLAVAVPGTLAAAPALPANTWVAASESQGGTIAGLTYLPDQRAMAYFGFPAPKATASDLRLYTPGTRQWSEPLPGRGPHQARGSLTTVFGPDQRPGLPTVNRPYWMAHQSVYVPPLKKILFFAGGATFTYDPEAKRWENLGIPLDKSPPDVMLGSMAWDPVGKRAILFGGGYISAHKPPPPTQPRPASLKGKPWTPADWNPAEKRATWAFDPASLTWSKLSTGSLGFRGHFGYIDDRMAKLDSLAGSVRGIALEYGDRVSGKPPEALAADSDSLGAESLEQAERLLAGEGCADTYERQQCRNAGAHLKEFRNQLANVSASLRERDGWKALHAIEKARGLLAEAGEDLAPSPLPRYYGNLVTDSRHKLLVLFGGHGGDRALADTWVFDSQHNQWRQSLAKNHPPPTTMPAMSFDEHAGVTFLSTGWVYDAGRDEWRRLPVAAPKGFFMPWTALEYDPVSRTHIALTTGDNLFDAGPVRVAQLQVDLTAAQTADHTGPRWEWLNDKYQRAWAALPRTQAEYRSRTQAHRAFLAKLPANSWARVTAPYNAQDRSYGSFALDPERGQLVFWGGGHSAYMGNEVSQYDIKGNLWLESWPPDLPPWPFGSPDGDGWNPPLYHQTGSAHGYHRYAYSAELDKVLFSIGDQLLPYDPDRMRWSPMVIRKTGSGTLGGPVDMSGSRRFYTLSARHWYGGPFGVWQLDPSKPEMARVPRSDTPFAGTDRAKAVFDTKRNRILFYGGRYETDKTPSARLLSFDPTTGGWSEVDYRLESPATQGPNSMAWGIAYSPKQDALFLLPGPRKQETWLLDLGRNTMRSLGPGPATQNGGTNGIVYSAAHNMLITLEVGNEGVGPVAVHLFPLK